MVEQTNKMMLKMRTLPPNFGQTTRKERQKQTLFRIVIKKQFLSLHKCEIQDAPFCVSNKSHKHKHPHTHTYTDHRKTSKEQKSDENSSSTL